MAAEGRVLYNYSGEYKKGLLGKKKISATLYEDYIEGVGAEIFFFPNKPFLYSPL